MKGCAIREQLLATERVTAIAWRQAVLYLLDQRGLPEREDWQACQTAAAVAEAIRHGLVRGAPAIGIAAAYGVVLGLQAQLQAGGDWRASLEDDFALLAAAQPAANWALKLMRERLQRLKPGEEALAALTAEAAAIHSSDREANLTMAQLGVELIRKQHRGAQKVLTHGNAGALAGGGFGTALGVIRAAHLQGLIERVYVDETRPSSEGVLTAWELASQGLPVLLNVDGAAAHLMKTENITWVIVGAECIAANGDLLGKIGTYQLAINAMHHGLRLMVVASASSIDMQFSSADEMLVDTQGPVPEAEVTSRDLFDVTPADLIDAIVTERGVLERPCAEGMARLLSRKRLH